jgi:hypothetical protein
MPSGTALAFGESAAGVTEPAQPQIATTATAGATALRRERISPTSPLTPGLLPFRAERGNNPSQTPVDAAMELLIEGLNKRYGAVHAVRDFTCGSSREY